MNGKKTEVLKWVGGAFTAIKYGNFVMKQLTAWLAAPHIFCDCS